MKLIKSLSIAAVMSLASMSAHAADAIQDMDFSAIPSPVEDFKPADTNPVMYAHDWSGFYVGANAGLANGKFKNTLTIFDMTGVNPSESNSRSTSGNGFIGGVQLGYNWQNDKFVYGIETDIQGSTSKKTKYLWNDAIDGQAKVQNKLDWLGTTRARLGYTVSDNTMLYVTGGLAYGRIKSKANWNVGSTEILNESWGKTKAGYALGAGGEFALTDDWSLKTEYMFTDLGKSKMFKYTDSSLDTGVEGKTKAQIHTIRAGINYKF